MTREPRRRRIADRRVPEGRTMSSDLRRVLLIGAGIVALLLVVSCGKLPPDQPRDDQDEDKDRTAKAGSYLFCFWNAENLFDDVDDHRKTKGDSEFDSYFGG